MNIKHTFIDESSLMQHNGIASDFFHLIKWIILHSNVFVSLWDQASLSTIVVGKVWAAA